MFYTDKRHAVEEVGSEVINEDKRPFVKDSGGSYEIIGVDVPSNAAK
jgi:Fe-S cluster biogenesis protein NfuA